MTKWMPPLPDKYPGEVKQWMLDYALAAVEAYKASLKPVAYFQPHNVDETDERIPVIGWRYKSEAYTMPLYLLDGGGNE